MIENLWKFYQKFTKQEIYDNNFTNWFNNKFQDKTNAFIIDRETFPIVKCKFDDLLYNVEKNIYTVAPFYQTIKLPEIKPNDICIDLGANIGVFTMLAAKSGAKVIAVEPITTDLLKKNLDLNGFKDVIIIPKFIGESKSKCVWWGNLYEREESILFGDIKKEYGCTILKSNCEGGEWTIQPQDLNGVRAIEIEFHYQRDYEINQELYDYIIDNYYVTIIGDDGISKWVSGVIK
jgi:hypothetical protein